MALRYLTAMMLLLLTTAPGCAPGCTPESSPENTTQKTSTSNTSEKTVQVKIEGHMFTLELALDAASRYQGLSDRASIASDGGMLFVFPRAMERTFVMRRCLVSIDILFLGPGGDIVSMAHMAKEPYERPDSQLKAYRSLWPAQFVIELAGGTLEKLSLKPGQKIKLPLASLKERVLSSDKY